MYRAVIISLLGLGFAQQLGTVNPEVHPSLAIQKCTKTGGCTSQAAKVVLDANWRWLHATNGYTNCFTDPSWNSTICPDPTTCAQNCALDGANYQSDYGVYASGSNLTLLLFPTSSVGSRVYLLSDDTHYQTFMLKNQEFTFDVDVSGLPCGSNGALYFVNMAADGGQSAYANNAAGAARGTGYCDAQCRQDLHFVNGQANLLNWNTGSRTGRYGSCCAEMDVWEANSAATALTAHTCTTVSQTRCDGTTTACGTACDQSGCDFNPYRNGNTSFYGGGQTVNTLPGKIRVITQFITSDNTATGTLTQVKRYYMRLPTQTVIPNAQVNVAGVSGNSLTDSYCNAELQAFGESNTFQSHGGMANMDKALSAGMVLTMSTFVDYTAGMRWLDSVYPDGSSPSGAGNTRGPCSTSSGGGSDLKSNYPNTQVKFSNIKYGDIGTTYGPPYT